MIFYRDSKNIILSHFIECESFIFLSYFKFNFVHLNVSRHHSLKTNPHRLIDSLSQLHIHVLADAHNVHSRKNSAIDEKKLRHDKSFSGSPVLRTV